MRFLMEERGVSQTEIAKKMGISQSYLSALIGGRRAWRQKEIEKIAAALETTVAELWGDVATRSLNKVPVTVVFEKGEYRMLEALARDQVRDLPNMLRWLALKFAAEQGRSPDEEK